MGSHALTDEIAALLASGERSAAGIALEPCTAGGNNRVYLVTAGSRQLIAKWYFSHPSDTRDRLSAEYSLLAYAERIGLDCVPRPVACDPATHLALYEFIEGRKLSAAEVDERQVDAALGFFLALNDPRHRDLAVDLPPASEACFSLVDHLSMVENRIARLDGIAPETDLDREAQAFVVDLCALWVRLKESVTRRVRALGFDPGTPLPEVDRCVSPSDFGFHNALATQDGRLVFLDFEYAGWDDPAKFANDFFCQPAVPVAERFYEDFIAEAMRFSVNATLLAERARLMRPIFQIKWCCIILNDFLPAAARRRRFADPQFDAVARKAMQLARVREFLSTICL